MPLSAVTRSLELRLVVSGVDALPVQADLRYEPADPYAVHATFWVDGAATRWVFGRDLLADGLVTPSGEGDVGVWPSQSGGRPVVCLSLSSPAGHALLEAEQDDVVELVREMYVAVPAGDEARHLSLDAVIDRLLDR
ncbi:MAG: SsgA family sporulation/cell division regulator [Actinomycetia bacterium]|jgi:hypothetical protein|nr:SsgA family sporulation/cell division regulator [Actinomycetes bacterium]